MNAAKLAEIYRNELLTNVLPFWEQHSVDHEFGGYFTCLDREGQIFGTDKYVWLQGRQVWMFSTLYNQLDARPEWLELAGLGASFLKDHARAADGTWYFALSREGVPLPKSYSIFSDCFAAIAFNQYYIATDDAESRELAESTYRSVMARMPDPGSLQDVKDDGSSRMLRLALPMIMSNVTIELANILEDQFVESTSKACISQLFEHFLDPDRNILRERISATASFVDNPNGRLVNPGHGIEAMWFAMDIGERFGDQALIDRAVEVMLSTIDFGWDREHDGIFYFLDIHGDPVQELEWDQKLWWVHLETLVALAMAYRLTGRSDCRDWFDRVHEYTWQRFPDPEYGEWWGYLNRRGEVSIQSKGGVWKGCFHVPRGLYRCMREFEKIQKHSP
jgi:N-acylglucosamine 2-epimerase